MAQRITQVPLGMYLAGNSWLHRVPAGWKFIGLFAWVIALTVTGSHLKLMAGAMALMCLLWLTVRVPWKVTREQLFPPFFLLLFVAAFQLWGGSFESALALFLRFGAAIMAAVLLTLTTTQGEMLETFDVALAPLARFGFPSAKVSLALMLTLTMIPVQLAQVYAVLDARKARGVGFDFRAFAVPVIVRSIRRAQMVGDALAARGVDDD